MVSSQARSRASAYVGAAEHQAGALARDPPGQPRGERHRRGRLDGQPELLPQPVLRSVSHSGDDCTLTWYAVAGTTYRVQAKTNLTDSNWVSIPGDVTAADALASKVVSTAGTGQRFFRVVIP